MISLSQREQWEEYRLQGGVLSLQSYVNVMIQYKHHRPSQEAMSEAPVFLQAKSIQEDENSQKVFWFLLDRRETLSDINGRDLTHVGPAEIAHEAIHVGSSFKYG